MEKRAFGWGALGVAFVVLAFASYRREARGLVPTQEDAIASGQGKIAALWAVNDGEKVGHFNLAHPAKGGNSAFRDGKAFLFGGRNEMLGLQLVVESGIAGIQALRISLPELIQRDGRSRITYRAPAEDPTDYVGRPIQLFAEHDMRVDVPTNAGWIFLPGAEPKGDYSSTPVQLVPENARAGRGGFPVQVGPRRNQVFWIDIYLGRDLQPGLYDGTLRVDADGEIREIPLELEVLDFTLPDENSVTYMIYYPSPPLANVEMYHGRNLDDRYHRFAHRNRVEFVELYTFSHLQAHLGRFDGSDFQPEHGYEGPGQGVGNRLAPHTFWGPDWRYLDPDFARADANAWMTLLAERLPRARTLFYMPDEPGPDLFDSIRKTARVIHDIDGPGKSLPVFATHGYTPELADAIDIWGVDSCSFDPARAKSERARGREMWPYNGCRPRAGSLVIDAPATDARMHGWATYKHEIPVYFYWHAAHWFHNQQAAPEHNRLQNVWSDPRTFVKRYNGGLWIGNGDGVLVYPGEERLHDEEDRGIAGPVSTIQMANLRRGVQDHLYLSMAARCGREDVVRAALQAIVPAVFMDAGEKPSFPERGDAYEEARRELAEAIAGGCR